MRSANKPMNRSGELVDSTLSVEQEVDSAYPMSR
jgi:hypothetical protein